MLRAHPAGGQLTNSSSSSLRTLLAGPWAPKLARLHNSGSINAWSTGEGNPWIQVRGVLWPRVLLGTVPGHTRSGAPCRRTHSHGRQGLTPAFHSQVDLLHLKIIHGIKTQGARQRLSSLYVSQFIVFYSLDGQRWKKYKGNTTSTQMVRRIRTRTDLKRNQLSEYIRKSICADPEFLPLHFSVVCPDLPHSHFFGLSHPSKYPLSCCCSLVRMVIRYRSARLKRSCPC